MITSLRKLIATAAAARFTGWCMVSSPQTPVEEIEKFLVATHGQEVGGLRPLDGGFWSSAYGYQIGEQDLVLRLSDSSGGFEMDRAAHRFARPGLPIPEVLEIGEALGRSFAISRRAHGSFLEDVQPDRVDRAAPMIDGLLGALRSVIAPPGASVDWFDHGPSSPTTWCGWLRDRLVDGSDNVVRGWRDKIASDRNLDTLYRQTEQRVLELLEVCPERRDLVHGDLLHQNVLIGADAGEVTAVFSWKCSVWGDHLYDVAWLSFWEPWHPGIASVDAWARAVGQKIDGDSLADAALRHHCYELNIGAQHLAWCSWTGNSTSLAGVAARTAHVLDRGPRSA